MGKDNVIKSLRESRKFTVLSDSKTKYLNDLND